MASNRTRQDLRRRRRRGLPVHPGLLLGLIAAGVGSGWYAAEQVRADIRRTMSAGRVGAGGFVALPKVAPASTNATCRDCWDDELGASYAAMLQLKDAEACANAPRSLVQGCRDYVRGAGLSETGLER